MKRPAAYIRMSNLRDPLHGPHVDIILNELGFGPYHVTTLLLVMLPMALAGLHSLNYVFTAGEVQYRCLVPECESDPPSFPAGPWASFALPPHPAGRCSRYKPTGSACGAASFSSEVVPCDAYVYENEDTIVPEFDLACAEWMRTSVGFVRSLAIVLSLPCTGYLSDSFGRRLAFVLTASVLKLAGLSKALATNYLTYLVLEFLDSALTSGNFMAGFMYYIELLRVSQRVRGGTGLHIIFALGQATLAPCAWAWPYWRTLTVVIYAPCLLFVLLFCLLDESPRWLLVKGRIHKGAKIVEKAARMNGKTLTTETQLILDTASSTRSFATTFKAFTNKMKGVLKGIRDKLLGDNDGRGDESVLYEVIKSKHMLKRLFLCLTWWIVVNFIYYGLTINSVSIPGNKYINFALISLVEVPGYLLAAVCLDRFSRRRYFMGLFFTCGIALCLQAALHYFKTSEISLAFALVGKLCISMVFASLFVYTLELFPLEARARVLGASSTLGRIGLLAAPHSSLLCSLHGCLVFVLLGALSVALGVTCACSGAVDTRQGAARRLAPGPLLDPSDSHLPLPPSPSEIKASYTNTQNI